MTTISNQNSLLDPLARTKGGCATNSNTASDPPPRREEVDEGYDGVMPILGIKQEDEDIASVEADGTGDTQAVRGSQSQEVEKKILTAALVTSMAEAPHSTVGDDTNRRVRTRSADKQAVKREVAHTSISYPGGGASHVTPTITSESSSFSSVESTDQESSSSSIRKCNDIPQLKYSGPASTKAHNTAPMSSATNSRTIYPRASKTAACTKVTNALSHPSGKPSSPKGKRKIDAVKSNAVQPTGKLMHHPPASSSVPNPLAGMDASNVKAPSTTQPQVTFQYLQYPNSKPPAKQAAPQPRAAKQPEGTNSFSTVAETMSSQQYQTDNLMSSSTNELMSSQNQPQQGRGRIFSIDLDPAVLDFVESVVDPLGNSEDAPQGRSRNYSVTFDDDVNSNSGRLSFRRDRGFSFEFFSFGLEGEDLLPSIDEKNPSSDASNGNRVRGDSIIFDPISFHDGGIHETSALMHVKHENQDNSQEYAASASVAAAAEPQVHQVKAPPSIIHNPPQAMHPAMYQQFAKGQSVASYKAPAKPKAKNSSQTKRTKKSQNVHVPQQQGSSKYRQITITTSSSSSRNYPQTFDDNTIHMPHGSDAAAAAAAGIAQPVSANSDGFSISHTSCPMELLNKGGRIGIYLPEERKARIAKFHDKRKQRMWRKKIKYDCRKKLADSRPRIKGRFVKRSDVDGEEGA